MPNRMLTDDEVFATYADVNTGTVGNPLGARFIKTFARRIEALVIERVWKQAADDVSSLRRQDSGDSAFEQAIALRHLFEKRAKSERLTLGKHEGADPEYAACPHNRQEVCAECKRVIAEGAEDGMGGGGRERAGNPGDAAPDTRLESGGRSPSLPEDAGSTPARHPSDSLAQDETEVERLTEIVRRGGFAERTSGKALDDLASITRRLLKERDEARGVANDLGVECDKWQAECDEARKEAERIYREFAENHRCTLPDSISEALNSGDGSYKP